jgi:hypothetical protein
MAENDTEFCGIHPGEEDSQGKRYLDKDSALVLAR